MQVYGLAGQTSEGIWPEAALRAIYLSLTNQYVNLHIALNPMFYLLSIKTVDIYYRETFCRASWLVIADCIAPH